MGLHPLNSISGGGEAGAERPNSRHTHNAKQLLPWAPPGRIGKLA